MNNNKRRKDQDQKRTYTKEDLWFNILCCWKRKANRDNNSANARYQNFMKDLLIFNKDRDIVKIINKVNTIEARYSLAEATANRINLKHKKQENKIVIQEETKSAGMSSEEILRKSKSIISNKKHVTSINNIVDHEIEQIREEIFLKEVPNKVNKNTYN